MLYIAVGPACGLVGGCLDNIDIDPEKAGLADAAAVAAALMHRGNAEAYELGRKLSRLVK